MKPSNERLVLQTIRLNGALSQARIAKLTRITPQTVSLILARLDQTRCQHNSASGKPWQIELSIGQAFLSGCRGISFAEVMAKADEDLYRRKKERKSAVSPAAGVASARHPNAA